MLLLLLALTVAFIADKSFHPLPGRLGDLPYGLVVLIALFGFYVWTQRREISRLRNYLQGFAEGQERGPSDQQLEKLFEVVSRSQTSFRELIDSFDRIAFSISLDGQIRVVNREFAEILGLPFAEIVNHPIEDFIAEPARADLERALPRFIEKRSWNGVLRVRWKKSNVVRFYDCTLYAVVKDGSVVGASGLARDISSQREAESRFTDLFETLHEGVYISQPDGTLVDANPALVRTLGYTDKEELFAAKPEDHFFNSREFGPLLGVLERQGQLRDQEILLRRKDGSSVPVLNSCVAIRDASGQIVRIQGSLVDITERRQMERRLREEQEFVRRLVACFPDVIVVLDTDGRYTFVSQRIQELLGYTPEEIVGGELEDRPHPEDREAMMKFFKDLVSGKLPVGALEYRTRHKDGRWRIFRANASPLTDSDQKVIGVVASARDVTEAKQLEQQLLQTEKLAAIGQMVSGVAHELNNPLTAIIGVSELLRERAPDDSFRRQTELVQKQARKAAGLVQDLLTFSRPSRPRSQQVRMVDLINRAIDLRRQALESCHISVEFDHPEHLPAVEADPNQLAQVFVNILSNAEQAISSIRNQGQIKIRADEVDGKLQVLIDDDGPGIPSEIRSKIFDPFFTTRRAGGGSGLGLTICLVIVKEHGGVIEALASPEGGARLRVLLPASSSPSTSEAAVSPAQRREGLKGSSILIVDDEDDIRELVSEGLGTRGASVDAASNADEAWSRLSRKTYDAVVCDFNLKGTGGLDLFDRVLQRDAHRTPRFLFITGDLLDPSQISSLEKKGARALQKPFQISELATALENSLAG
ncbi:MAG TPA: PAS domain S-box protein [Candidatus Acidoferrales bacterium]|nr:PAS domain S-box protein [Candidatus Acidoferrales bacterium]